MRKKKSLLLLLILLIPVTVGPGCIGKVKTYDTAPDRLSLGEVATIDGVVFTVERYDLRDEFAGNHDLNVFYDTQGHKYLYVLVNARNTGSKPVEIPSIFDVTVMYKDRPYVSEVSYHSEELEMYEYNWLEERPIGQGYVREGWVLFEVPETINASDVQVIVEFPHTSYTQTAIWSLTS